MTTQVQLLASTIESRCDDAASSCLPGWIGKTSETTRAHARIFCAQPAAERLGASHHNLVYRMVSGGNSNTVLYSLLCRNAFSEPLAPCSDRGATLDVLMLPQASLLDDDDDGPPRLAQPTSTSAGGAKAQQQKTAAQAKPVRPAHLPPFFARRPPCRASLRRLLPRLRFYALQTARSVSHRRCGSQPATRACCAVSQNEHPQRWDSALDPPAGAHPAAAKTQPPPPAKEPVPLPQAQPQKQQPPPPPPQQQQPPRKPASGAKAAAPADPRRIAAQVAAQEAEAARAKVRPCPRHCAVLQSQPLDKHRAADSTLTLLLASNLGARPQAAQETKRPPVRPAQRRPAQPPPQPEDRGPAASTDDSEGRFRREATGPALWRRACNTRKETPLRACVSSHHTRGNGDNS